MKNTKGNPKKSYLRAGFILPMLYSAFTAVLMGLVYAVNEAHLITDPQLAMYILSAGQISVLFSPPALIVFGSMANKHKNRFPLESFFYCEAPLVFTAITVGFQVLYLFMSRRTGV